MTYENVAYVSNVNAAPDVKEVCITLTLWLFWHCGDYCCYNIIMSDLYILLSLQRLFAPLYYTKQEVEYMVYICTSGSDRRISVKSKLRGGGDRWASSGGGLSYFVVFMFFSVTHEPLNSGWSANPVCLLSHIGIANDNEPVQMLQFK